MSRIRVVVTGLGATTPLGGDGPDLSRWRRGIAEPITGVSEAIVNPAQLSRYFTTGGAKGRLETGATISWEFQFSRAFPVWVVEVEPERRIVLRWEANDGAPSDGDAAVTASAGYKTAVTMTFEPLEDGRTLVSIAEEAQDRSGSQGILRELPRVDAPMLCTLKAFVQYGINLREGMFK